MKRITILLLLVLCVGWTHATIYYVSPTGDNTTGLTWATAYTSPAAALAGIAAGTSAGKNEVWVKQGTYLVGTTLSWKTGINFYGGFVGNETSRSQRSTDASLTILDGGNLVQVFKTNQLTYSTFWDGFTIQNGSTSGGGGGGLLQRNSILQNCIVQNCKTTNFGGGGISISGSATEIDSIKVINCIIRNNLMTDNTSNTRGGGGIQIKSGSILAVIRNCVIEENVCDGLGGSGNVGGAGIHMFDGKVENCIIRNNYTTNKTVATGLISLTGKCQGGGILVTLNTTSYPVNISKCNIYGNSVFTSSGGGVCIDPGSQAITSNVNISNTTIKNNYALKYGGGIYSDRQSATATSSYKFENCIVSNNRAELNEGGGAYVKNTVGSSGNVSFTNCNFLNNRMSSSSTGGAGVFYNAIPANIKNCVFWGNTVFGATPLKHHIRTADVDGNVIENCAFDTRFSNSDVNATTIIINKITLELENTGNVAGKLYPKFINPTSIIGSVVTNNADSIATVNNANWQFNFNSALANTGTTIAGITTDITGLARPQGSAYDIGAYELRAYDIAATSNNETMGSVSGTGAKLSGSSVTLTATSNNDYHFVNWTEGANVVSTNSSYTFTSGANRTLVANFEANTHSVGTGIVNASDVPCSTCDVTIAAGAELKINSTKTLKSITVAPGAKLTVNANQTLTATNGITLQSDENGTGSFVDLTTSNPQSITATVQQHVTAGRNWYMSIPFASASSSFFNKGTSVVCFDEPTGTWIAPAEGTLNKMRGYIQTAKSSPEITGTTGNIELTGVLNTGVHSINLTRTEGKTGFNLVGNPYPSYLDWNLVTKNNVSNTMWLRTKEGTEYKFYTYVANEGSGIGSPASVTNLIPPMQAFWVRVNTVAGGSIAVENTMRAHKDVTGNILKAPKSESQKILRLQVNNGINSDETVIYFNPKASDNLDQYDAPKRSNSNPSIPEIFTQIGNETLVINGMNEIKYNTEIPIGFRTGQSNNFNLSINEFSNFENGTKIILKDKMNPSNEIELNESTSYNFTSDISTNNTDRFSLTFKSPDFTTDFSQVKEISSVRLFVDSDNKITIISPDTFNYSILNTFGQEIQSGRSDIRNITITGLTVSGIYVVKISDDKGNKYTSKVIIK